MNKTFFNVTILFVVASLFCLLTNPGYAKTSTESDSFSVIKDGVEYFCQRQTSPDPMGNLNCRELAYKGPFSKEQSKSLCENSFTESPAECGIMAYKGPFLHLEAITLCKYAKNKGPAECAIKAYNGPFLKAEAIEICKTMGTQINADCAIKAYNSSGYSKEEAISTCKATRTLNTIDNYGKPAQMTLKREGNNHKS